MDVLNGKIVNKELVAGTEKIWSRGSAMTMDEWGRMTGTNGGERQDMADQQHAWSGMRASQGLGLIADARVDAGRSQQASAGGSVQWVPTWVASGGMYVGNNSSPAAAVSASLAPATPWGNLRTPERGGRGAHGFMGMQDQHRQGWKRAADQESSRNAEFHVPLAMGLKPSRARVGGGRSVLNVRDQLPGSFARAATTDWAPSVSSLEPTAGRRLGVNAAARSEVFHVSPQQSDQRQGWKPSSQKRSTSGHFCPRCGSVDQRRQHHFDASPCSEGKLDEEMSQFELQLTCSVSDHFSNRSSLRCPKSSQSSSPVVNAAGDGAASLTEKKAEELITATTVTLKRKRSGLADGDVEGEWGWTLPLKLLVRKGLTVSDVGELSRIILPKKDAESQGFPQIGTKEGRVLEMDDYFASKRWYFRFKYWINNKSRMYVLENTGDFIKFYSLKEHDMFVIYEDGCKKLVVCGQKKNNGESSDPVLERSKSSISETPPTTTEDESSDRLHQHR